MTNKVSLSSYRDILNIIKSEKLEKINIENSAFNWYYPDTNTFTISKSEVSLSGLLNKADTLREVNINIDTKDVLNLDRAFSGLKLKKLDLSNLNLSNLESANYIFYNSSIDEIILPKIENAYSFNFAFSNLEIKKINIDAIDFTKAVSMNKAFFRIDTEENLDLTNVNFENLTLANYMFGYCTSKILLSEKLSFPKLKEAVGMFSYSDIEDKNIFIENLDKLELAPVMFYEAKINDVVLETSNLDDVLKNLESAFAYAKINRVTLKNFTGERLYDMSNAFTNSNIKDVDLSTLIASNLELAYSTFEKANINNIYINSMIMNEDTDVSNIIQELNADSNIYLNDTLINRIFVEK